MAEITIEIKGRPWRFLLLTDRRFDKLHNTEDAEAIAITLATTYEVHFRKSSWDMVTIRHELLHVLFNASLSSSAGLDPLQVEEICAEIVGHHTLEIALWADKIAEKFLGRE